MPITDSARNGLSSASDSQGTIGAVLATASSIIGSSADPSSTISTATAKSDRLNTIKLPADTPPYYFRILMSDYHRASWLKVGDLNPSDVVILPIPITMVDGHNVQWDGEEIGALGGFAMAAVAAGQSRDPSDALAAGKQGVAGLGTFLAQGLKGAASELTGGKSDGAIAGVNAALGISINNFMTIMLKGPTYKQHSFSWKISPNTPEETMALTDLYRVVNNAQAPSLVSGSQSTFFSYPKIFTLAFKHSSGIDMGKMLYRFKPCVLTGSQWNFAPMSPAFYGQTKGPEALQFTLQFTELEFWLSGDFK